MIDIDISSSFMSGALEWKGRPRRKAGPAGARALAGLQINLNHIPAGSIEGFD
jgi:hypothetical protein